MTGQRPVSVFGRWGLILGVPAAVLVLTWQMAGGVGEVEMIGALVLLGSLSVAFGGGVRSRRVEQRDDVALAARADAALDRLDPLEHRRIDLGRPWPRLVVGPSGVSVVDVCPYFDLAHTAEKVRTVLAGHDGAAAVPVRAVRVTDAPPTPPAVPRAGVGMVAVDDLPQQLVEGPVLPMTTVDGLFRVLARHDLQSLDPGR